jgi:hypothetical protein
VCEDENASEAQFLMAEDGIHLEGQGSEQGKDCRKMCPSSWVLSVCR